MSIFQIKIWPNEDSMYTKMEFEVKASGKEQAESIARHIINSLNMNSDTLFERAWLRDI